MMKVKKALVWSVLCTKEHSSLSEKELNVERVYEIIEALFPGMNYYSITGFGEVKKLWLIPALNELFPDLVFLAAEDIKPEEMVKIDKFLPSKGYEWDSPRWKAKFNKLLIKAHKQAAR